MGADTDLLSCRNWGVLENAYGAIGADVPLYPVAPEWVLYAWFRGVCVDRCCGWCGWPDVF